MFSLSMANMKLNAALTEIVEGKLNQNIRKSANIGKKYRCHETVYVC